MKDTFKKLQKIINKTKNLRNKTIKQILITSNLPQISLTANKIFKTNSHKKEIKCLALSSVR